MSDSKLANTEESPYWWAKGTWFTIHAFAKNATNVEKRKAFCIFIRELSHELPCEECQVHMREYVTNFPPDYSPDCFEWAWRFHNAVNELTGKDPIPYEVIRSKYYNAKACTSCGTGKGKKTIPEPVGRKMRVPQVKTKTPQTFKGSKRFKFVKPRR
jgi:hypothetical protein